jgi:hypothetical protein
MDLGLIFGLNGQLEFKHCRTKKAFLQKISELIDECEAKGATVFDLLLNTDINKED